MNPTIESEAANKPSRSTSHNSMVAYAVSVLHHVHWFLFAFTVFLTIVVYFEPVPIRYLGYSLAVGIVWCTLTLVTWRRRSNLMAFVTFFTVLWAHSFNRPFVPSHRASLTGILISGITMFWIFLLARHHVRRFCDLPNDCNASPRCSEQSPRVMSAAPDPRNPPAADTPRCDSLTFLR